MAFRTAVVIASFLIGLGAMARESFAQYYPPQAYPRPRDYPLAGYPPLPPRTTVGTSGLLVDGSRIEIDLIGAVG